MSGKGGERLSMPKYDYRLDVVGRACPYPAIMAKKKVERIEENSVLLVLTDAPNSVENIREAVKGDARIIGVYRSEGGVFSIFLRKLRDEQ